MAEIVVKESKDDQFYWVVKASNGEPVATSETYTQRSDAEQGARALVVAVLEVIGGAAAELTIEG